MTACPVHVVKLPGCPHPNPADIYGRSTPQTDTDMANAARVAAEGK